LCQLTLAHESQLVIHHVPVIHCEQCDRSEVYSAVKETLYHVLSPVNHPKEHDLDFEQFSECARYLMQVNTDEIELETCMNTLFERMDDLLDLLGFAMSTNDQTWSQDIQRRLRELHVVVQTVDQFSV
jgi:hypothetical protein